MRKLSLLVIILLCSCHSNKENQYFENIKDNDVALSKPVEGEWLFDHKEKGQSFEGFMKSKHAIPTVADNIIYIKPIGNFDALQIKQIALVRKYLEIYFQLKTKVSESISNDIIPDHVIEGQDVVDAVAQGDALETVEIIRVGEEAEKWNAIEAFIALKGARLKRDAALKAESEAKMEQLAAGFDKTDSGLRYKMIQKGDGKKAEAGKTVSVHYEGSLETGKVFDSSYPRKKPIEFRLGQGQVIEGWDEGIALLQVGDKARFVIPSDLAYGAAGAGGVIPPNATLIFDVELMDVK